jgi:two-component system chemotaxis response regulator CheY
MIGIGAFTNPNGPVGKTATVSTCRGRHMKTREDLEVLIVEDRQVMLKIIRRLLVQLGYARVDEAVNGLQALERTREKRYDLILSDWNMDGMSGFDLLKILRADPATHATPFILVTAEAKPENILAAKAAGASGYLLKPFKLDMLEKTLDGVLASHGFVSLAVAS